MEQKLFFKMVKNLVEYDKGSLEVMSDRYIRGFIFFCQSMS
jgi:hypothetical protein